MKILHICLACFYKEGFGYQENLLPKFHKKIGYEVEILARAEAFLDGKFVYLCDDYVNSDGINVGILKFNDKNKLSSLLGRTFLVFSNILQKIEKSKPDIIFVHGGQSLSLLSVISYCKKKYNTKLFIDQHLDYYNEPHSGKILTIKKLLYKYVFKRATSLCSMFWGTTPWRCQYLREVYNLPDSKIGLLVMGGDDTYIHLSEKDSIRNQLRSKMGIQIEDFVIISGGKIDKAKNIHLLIQAIEEIDCDRIKVVIFGTPDDYMRLKLLDFSQSKHVINIGWVKSEDIYDYYLASDLAVFPGTHSVLWEQACACGLPGIFNDWNGMRHIDCGGNVVFVDGNSVNEIKKAIMQVYSDKALFARMKEVALLKATKEFSYSEIARRSVSL